MTNGHLRRRFHDVLALLVTLGLLLALPFTSDGQAASRGRVEHVEQTATLVRQGAVQDLAVGDRLEAGDRLTTEEGRIEITLDRGPQIHADHDTVLDVLDTGLLRLLAGRIRIQADSATLPHRIDTADTVVVVDRAAEIVMSRAVDRTQIDVVRGMVSIGPAETGLSVGAGQSATIDSAGTSTATFNTARWNEFDRWVERRRVATLDRYAPRIIRSRLTSAAPRPPTSTPLSPSAARMTWQGPIHPHAWAPSVPWLVGGVFCCAHLPPAEPAAAAQTPAAPAPDSPVAEPPSDPPAFVPPSVRAAALRLPATARLHAGTRRFGGSRRIVLPVGGSTPVTATGSSAGSTSTATTTGPVTANRPSPTSSAQPVRPGTAPASLRTPGRSSRAERVGSRSARRSGGTR